MLSSDFDGDFVVSRDLSKNFLKTQNIQTLVIGSISKSAIIIGRK